GVSFVCQAEAGIRDFHVTGVQTCALPIFELDTRASDAERDKAEGERETALLDAARARAMLLALESGRQPRLARLGEVAAGRWRRSEERRGGEAPRVRSRPVQRERHLR